MRNYLQNNDIPNNEKNIDLVFDIELFLKIYSIIGKVEPYP